MQKEEALQIDLFCRCESNCKEHWRKAEQLLRGWKNFRDKRREAKEETLHLITGETLTAHGEVKRQPHWSNGNWTIACLRTREIHR